MTRLLQIQAVKKAQATHAVSLPNWHRRTSPHTPCCCAAAGLQPPSDWRATAGPFLAAMKGMTRQTLLTMLAEEGVPAAQELQDDQRELEAARQMQAASRAALKDAAVQGRTNEGRQTYQTLLTAFAYDGEEGPSTLPDCRKAEILGVNLAVLSLARQRAASLQPALRPAAALGAGAYWYRSRRPRSDATPPELEEADMMEPCVEEAGGRRRRRGADYGRGRGGGRGGQEKRSKTAKERDVPTPRRG